MSIIAKNKTVEFDPIDAGSCVARVWQMIEIGNIAEFSGGNSKQSKNWALNFRLK